MGYFDFLIDKENNIKPVEGMEYIYMMDKVWKPGKLESQKIEDGTVVENVVKMENGEYHFNIKGSDEKLCTNYGWALAENTEENKSAISEYERVLEVVRKAKIALNRLRGKIKTLNNK